MRGILLDIEGTTSSIRFVTDVMFGLARRELDPFLRAHWEEPGVQRACERIAADAGGESLAAWCGGAAAQTQREHVAAEVVRLMDRDAKTTGLKELQGLIWKQGFESGQMRAHLYPDVLPALRRWKEAGRQIRIFSSGSVAAQQLFFGHTEEGDLLAFFSGHYDTTLGPKKEPESYLRIAAEFDLAPGQILFLSDSLEELDAARSVGMATGLSIRPENAPVPDGHGHTAFRRFDDIQIE